MDYFAQRNADIEDLLSKNAGSLSSKQIADLKAELGKAPWAQNEHKSLSKNESNEQSKSGL